MRAQHGAQEHVHVPCHLGAGAPLHRRGRAACCLRDRPPRLPSPAPAPRWGDTPTTGSRLCGSHGGGQSVVTPKCQSVCLSGDSQVVSPGSHLCGRPLRTGGVSTCWGVPMAVLTPENDTCHFPARFPLSALHSLAFQTDAPACLFPSVCPAPRPGPCQQ